MQVEKEEEVRVLWALKAGTGSLVSAQVLGSQRWYLTVEGKSLISVRLIWRGSREPIIMRQMRDAGRHRTRPGGGFSPQTPHSSGKKYRATFTMPTAFSHLLPAVLHRHRWEPRSGAGGGVIRPPTLLPGETLATRPPVQGGGASLRAQATGSSL